MNFSNLDLRKCQLYGINLERSSFAEAKLSKNTLFFKGHNSSIRNAGFSPDGNIFSQLNMMIHYGHGTLML